MVKKFKDSKTLFEDLASSELCLGLYKSHPELEDMADAVSEGMKILIIGRMLVEVYPLKGSGSLACRRKTRGIIFFRWDAAGYNRHHAKRPYTSKKFKEYLKDIGFHDADYLAVCVD